MLGGALLAGCSACLGSVGFGIVRNWGKVYTSIRRELVTTHFLMLAFQVTLPPSSSCCHHRRERPQCWMLGLFHAVTSED